MKSIPFRRRLRYRFDNLMSRGPIALIGWLFIASIALIAVISSLVVAWGIDPNDRSFLDVAWASLMRTLDAGTMGGDEGSWPFLIAMLAVTMGGIFVVSTLIGVLTTGIEGKLDELRKGRSFVAEKGHTVILGWSSQVFTLVSEIAIANENHRRGCIAILAEKDAVEMQDEIKSKVGDTRRTKVVCRTGSPIDLADLEIVNPHAARSIVVLAPETGDPDATVIKTILAIVNNPNRHQQPYHIVAVIRDQKNLQVARMVGRDEAQLVLANDLIARVTAQTCRQSGLSVAYTELLDFGGDEIYFQEEPALAGRTFGEALMAYEDSCVIGLRRRDGRIMLNPPMESRIESGDKIIAISEDDDTIRLSGRSDYGIDPRAIKEAEQKAAAPEGTLILGWNHRATTIIRELDNYVAAGSEVMVVSEIEEAQSRLAALQSECLNTNVSFRKGDTTDRRLLDDLQVPAFDHVIVLSQTEGINGASIDPQQADARTLITLLHLRDIGMKHGFGFSIVSEMLDVRNRELAQVTRADDFIVSDKMLSLMLSQISENKELTAVFQDLFDPEGSEMYLKPAENYVEIGRAMNFYTVVESARRRGEVAVGFRLQAEAYNPAKSYGVKVNPKKSVIVSFSKDDRIIVLAED
jgi:voltage-gated potassium channel Kch